ncbi:hypothetical protein BV25DRAFT_1918187 [Artomyces pyxidatus]|uniref:Uncharacterized protein n=1 Tax=Artomyces pyxidatus TaxID=48021 RepID=A0ACB8SVB0_9AGAM|nr:hypothetical protein BV25DRAFT_1918187 [Artomyces pyxidatus]
MKKVLSPRAVQKASPLLPFPPPVLRLVNGKRSYPLNEEIWFNILNRLSIETLSILRSTNHTVRGHVARHLRLSWNESLSSYFMDPVRFRDVLRSSRSIISGSFVLHFVLRATRFADWCPGDMDIYCPVSSAASVVDYLIYKEHYVAFKPEGREGANAESPLHEYDGAIACVVQLRRWDGRRVDVICATRNGPLLPLTHFWGTIVTNFISADTLSIPYPRLTLRGRCCLNPERLDDSAVRDCLDKYIQRGFALDSFVASGAHHTTITPMPLYCPHTYRHFADPGCLVFDFGSKDTGDQIHTQLADFPVHLPLWKWGGDACSALCHPTSEVRDLVLMGVFA